MILNTVWMVYFLVHLLASDLWVVPEDSSALIPAPAKDYVSFQHSHRGTEVDVNSTNFLISASKQLR